MKKALFEASRGYNKPASYYLKEAISNLLAATDSGVVTNDLKDEKALQKMKDALHLIMYVK